jgi:hypothetical protein
MALQPVRVFSGSFAGPTLYENPAYVSPNAVRRLIKQRAAGKYNAKVGGGPPFCVAGRAVCMAGPPFLAARGRLFVATFFPVAGLLGGSGV